jgi:hypothetical protein
MQNFGRKPRRKDTTRKAETSGTIISNGSQKNKMEWFKLDPSGLG